jgi:hypothetical protein
MVYTSVKDRIPMGVDQFFEAARDFDVVPLTEAGEVIGGVLARGREVHIGYGRKPRASIRPHLRATLGEMLRNYGYVLTSVQAENIVGLRFCERLGFVKLGEEDGKIVLRCDRSSYL